LSDCSPHPLEPESYPPLNNAHQPAQSMRRPTRTSRCRLREGPTP
jgi:hypothetical protein